LGGEALKALSKNPSGVLARPGYQIDGWFIRKNQQPEKTFSLGWQWHGYGYGYGYGCRAGISPYRPRFRKPVLGSKMTCGAIKVKSLRQSLIFAN
jgi:hypothetical protein